MSCEALLCLLLVRNRRSSDAHFHVGASEAKRSEAVLTQFVLHALILLDTFCMLRSFSILKRASRSHAKTGCCLTQDSRKHKRRERVQVRGSPERRMQVRVGGTGRGLDNDAGFVVVVPSPWLPPGPAHNRISLEIGSNHDPAATHPTFRFPCFGKDLHSS